MDPVKILKRVLFLLLAPLYGALFAFMHLTYKWWEGLNAPAA